MPQLTKAGVPDATVTDPAVLGAMAGCDPGGRARPGRRRPSCRQLQQFADQVMNAIFEAFSVAIASTFWLGVIAASSPWSLVAVALPEVTLRGMGADAKDGEAGRADHGLRRVTISR